ncbi:hypothetical protein ABEV74_02555 [Paenibacillus cisolokensis]|uniref:YphA family membrane protein n=1 Tax=Paenibacillus cisolokensis TaxID=1658519 RepID=UPI003D29363B
MNAGFLSLWLLSIFAILMTTGWKEIVAEGRLRVIVGWAVLCLLAQPVAFSVFGVPVSASACCLLAAAIAGMRRADDRLQTGLLLTESGLIALIWYGIRACYASDPVFVFLDPRWDAPIAAGVLAAAFTFRPASQFGLVAFSALTAESLPFILHERAAGAAPGSWAWWDAFWISFASARGCSVLYMLIRSAAANPLAHVFRRKKQS